MSITTETAVQFPARRAIGQRGRKQFDALATELQAALAREQTLCQRPARAGCSAKSCWPRNLSIDWSTVYRLVVSLLSLQSRTAPTPEAAAQLTIAGRRVSALGRVHHRLHLLDHQDKVEFKQYLQQLCEDLSGLLFEVQTGYAIEVEGPEIEIPTASAIPLGFIVNELITNSAKYAKSHITVRIEAISATQLFAIGIGRRTGIAGGFRSRQQHRTWDENHPVAGQADWRRVSNPAARKRSRCPL